METNLLVAIANLVKNPITNLVSRYNAANRANSMGDALEFYIKDLFCNSLDEKNIEKKNEIYSKYFSYIGNQNNPPDILLRGSLPPGDSRAFKANKIRLFRSRAAVPAGRLRRSVG